MDGHGVSPAPLVRRRVDHGQLLAAPGAGRPQLVHGEDADQVPVAVVDARHDLRAHPAVALEHGVEGGLVGRRAAVLLHDLALARRQTARHRLRAQVDAGVVGDHRRAGGQHLVLTGR